MAGGFAVNTRRKIVPLSNIIKPAGGGSSPAVQLPKTGILARIFLAIRGSIAGSLTAPNALGMASILSRVRLTANSGVDMFNISGAGYHYILRELLESEYIDLFGQSNARSAVTATSFNLDMVIPMALNLRDMIGVIALQNEQTILSLAVDWLADASVATGATVTATITPYLELYTVPVDPADWPPFNVVHNILEDTQAVAATGDFVYNWPRGNTYLQIGHGLGFGAAGADSFNRFRIRVNQSDYLQDSDIPYLDMEHRFFRGRARPAGTVNVDFLASSGLGNYGLARDFYDSTKVTDLASVLTATAIGTLYTVRRQLVVLQ